MTWDISHIVIAIMYLIAAIIYIFTAGVVIDMFKLSRELGYRDLIIGGIVLVVAIICAAMVMLGTAYVYLFGDQTAVDNPIGNHFATNRVILLAANVGLEPEWNANHYSPAWRSGIRQAEYYKNKKGLLPAFLGKEVKQSERGVHGKRERARRIDYHGASLSGFATAPRAGRRGAGVQIPKPPSIMVTKTKISEGIVGQTPILVPFEQVAAKIYHGLWVRIEEDKPQRLVYSVVFNGWFVPYKNALWKQENIGVLRQLALILHKAQLGSGLIGEDKRCHSYCDIRTSNHQINCRFRDFHKKSLTTSGGQHKPNQNCQSGCLKRQGLEVTS